MQHIFRLGFDDFIRVFVCEQGLRAKCVSTPGLSLTTSQAPDVWPRQPRIVVKCKAIPATANAMTLRRT